jgi:hypothetical protein
MEKHPKAQGEWKLDKEQDGTGQVNSRELAKVRNAAIIGSVAVPDIYLEYVISHCTCIHLILVTPSCLLNQSLYTSYSGTGKMCQVLELPRVGAGYSCYEYAEWAARRRGEGY